ncbi:MAG: hypothetical protein BJ554DRAFT_7271 [Olpidium bornovanus]|uniref:Uncharacterized protein n=1 Tax=Olpidium bornovanus TaxID=278681 RepID=A0A8H8A1Y4_9FUNG|nr:MAG: hypothetical protein BJ554DRAFT_7271 [Olpidium bornovanus]
MFVQILRQMTGAVQPSSSLFLLSAVLSKGERKGEEEKGGKRTGKGGEETSTGPHTEETTILATYLGLCDHSLVARGTTTSDWKPNPVWFRALEHRWGPRIIDLFATKRNRPLPRFASRDPEGEAITDAFTIDLVKNVVTSRRKRLPPRGARSAQQKYEKRSRESRDNRSMADGTNPRVSFAVVAAGVIAETGCLMVNVCAQRR